MKNSLFTRLLFGALLGGALTAAHANATPAAPHGQTAVPTLDSAYAKTCAALAHPATPAALHDASGKAASHTLEVTVIRNGVMLGATTVATDAAAAQHFVLGPAATRVVPADLANAADCVGGLVVEVRPTHGAHGPLAVTVQGETGRDVEGGLAEAVGRVSFDKSGRGAGSVAFDLRGATYMVILKAHALS